jgi:hypothetical protein
MPSRCNLHLLTLLLLRSWASTERWVWLLLQRRLQLAAAAGVLGSAAALRTGDAMQADIMR